MKVLPIRMTQWAEFSRDTSLVIPKSSEPPGQKKQKHKKKHK